MKYYMPVGPGGVFFRTGMFVLGMMGSLVYWRACRRRGAAAKGCDLRSAERHRDQSTRLARVPARHVGISGLDGVG